MTTGPADNRDSLQVYAGKFSQRIAGLLVGGRWFLLVLAIAIAASSWYFSRQLEFDRSIESMFAAGDPVLEPYQRLRQRFGGNEIILAVYEDNELFDASGCGIQRLTSVSQKLQQVEGVKGVLSLAELNRALLNLYEISEIATNPLRLAREMESIYSGLGKESAEGTDSENAEPSAAEAERFPIVADDDQLAADFRQMFEGLTHSPDGKTVAIACILDPSNSQGMYRQRVIEDLRAVITADELNGQLTGEPVMVADGFRYVQRDGQRLGVNCLVLMSLVIIACFRSIRWVVIPLAATQLTLWMTRAVLVISGYQLSMVSSMLTAIVTVIAVATSMHLTLRFREARGRGEEPKEAMRSAIALLFWPVVWSCLTDAAGFLALVIAEVGPVQDFGVMMAIASLLVLVSIGLLAAPLGLSGKMDVDPQKAWGESGMRSALGNSALWLGRAPGLFAILIAAAALLVACGNFFVKVETDFTRNFRADTPVAVSYRFVEERLGGAGLIDVVLPAPKRITAGYLEQVVEFEDRLRLIDRLEFAEGSEFQLDRSGPDQAALTKVISIADVDQASRDVPGVSLVPLQLRLAGMRQIMPELFDLLLTPQADRNGQRFFRVMLRTSQRDSAEEKIWLIGKVQQLADECFPTMAGSAGPETTGFYVLLSNLVQSILRDQYRTFALAVAAIFLVMLVALRRLKLAVIAMIPNLLPVLVVLGALGWLGIRINMGAAMIAAVSLGLSIDSSIHYLWAFHRWRKLGLGVDEAIAEVQIRVGGAVVFSTLALMLGFSSLCFSEFVPTVFFWGPGRIDDAGRLGGEPGRPAHPAAFDAPKV